MANGMGRLVKLESTDGGEYVATITLGGARHVEKYSIRRAPGLNANVVVVVESDSGSMLPLADPRIKAAVLAFHEASSDDGEVGSQAQ